MVKISPYYLKKVPFFAPLQKGDFDTVILRFLEISTRVFLFFVSNFDKPQNKLILHLRVPKIDLKKVAKTKKGSFFEEFVLCVKGTPTFRIPVHTKHMAKQHLPCLAE